MAPSFISRVEAACPCDTILTLEAAAEHRLMDGLQLALHPRHETGAVYLLGYAAEMLVKTAYYRFRRIPEAMDVSSPGSVVRALGAGWPGGNFHRIDAWLRLLIGERGRSPNPVPPDIAGLALIHVTNIWLHWRETLRYASLDADTEALEEVYASVTWLKKRHRLLWR